VETFRQTIEDAAQLAAGEEAIVTIGIQPTAPATGFGYIEAGDAVEARTVTRFHKANRFVEKPDVYTAARYVESGKYFWNSGMFIWRAGVMHAALREHAPELADLSDGIAAAASQDEVDATMRRVYPSLRAISIDYAVMEHVKNIVMARGAFGWDDVGSWPAVAGHFTADAAGNVAVGTCEPMESADNIVVSENRLTALIGVSGLVVVQSDNVTLICPKERAEDVKKLLRRIAERPDGEKYV
jgi:mannose-1-phosphate guanylyltransferase